MQAKEPVKRKDHPRERARYLNAKTESSAIPTIVQLSCVEDERLLHSAHEASFHNLSMHQSDPYLHSASSPIAS